MSKDHAAARATPSLMNLAPGDAVKGAVGVTAFYIGAATHIAPFLSQPGGLSERLFLPIWLRVFSILRLGVPAKGKVPIALLVAGAAVTFVFTAVGSVTANAAGNAQGYENKEPRAGKRSLKGLYARMANAHDNLLEFFPAFAVAAVMASQYDSKGTFDNQLALVATLK